MRAPRIVMWSWPGLEALWLSGQVSGLVQAGLFALLLNLCLVSTWVWPAWVDPSLRLALWLGLVAYWCLSTWSAWRHRDDIARSGDPGALFIQAQSEYLKGDWYGAERTLRHLLQWRTTDLEARLLLATLYRHTKRWDEAQSQLRQIQKLAPGTAWRPELGREWEFLRRDVECQAPTSEQRDTAERDSDSPPAPREPIVSRELHAEGQQRAA